MFVEIADPGVRQQCAGILARSLVLGADADRLIAFLEVIRGADDLLVKGLIEFAPDSADMVEDVLAWLDLLDGDRGSVRRSLRDSCVACRDGTGGSAHHPNDISPREALELFGSCAPTHVYLTPCRKSPVSAGRSATQTVAASPRFS
jgi:hypothetical protein